MIDDIIKFYEVGKELGLTKKEITQIMSFDNSKYAYLWRFLLFIVLLLIIIVGYNALRWLFWYLMKDLHSILFKL
jgi:hypothetical protein